MPVGAGDVRAGAAGLVPAGVPVPFGVAELATGGAAEVEYSLAVEEELDDGAVAESGTALLDVDGLPVDEGLALGPGTSTWTFGGAPSGCGITTIGPTCTGPTVIGAGSPSVDWGEAEGLAGGAVVPLGVEFAGGGAPEGEVSTEGATSEREAVGVDGTPVRCAVAPPLGAGGWIGSTVLGDVVDGLVRRGGCCRSLVSLGEAAGARRLAGVPRSLGAGAARSDDESTAVALD